MKFKVLPLLLALLTIFVMGRVGLSLMQHEQPIILVQQPVQIKVVEADPVAALPTLKSAAKQQQVNLAMIEDPSVWGANIIPSAEAAAGITLAEENEQMPSSKDLNALREAKAKLDQREKDLSEKKKYADEAEALAVKRIAELKELEARIQDLLVQEKSISDKKIKRLTSVYEGMKAAKAAPVIAQMELITVVKMFSRMNEKQVGKILSFLPPRQAVLISQALTKRIGSLP